jgi:hypothetical protein
MQGLRGDFSSEGERRDEVVRIKYRIKSNRYISLILFDILYLFDFIEKITPALGRG